MLPIRLLLLSLLIAASTVLHVVPLLLVAVVKALLPSDRLRRASNPVLTGVAESWIGVNNWMMDRFTGTRVGVEEDAALQVDGHYLVLANHQSWVDILVLQKVFNRRIPLLRFFLKRQLFWVPLLGLAWWALDFPFMGRYTPKQIARRPELAGRDIEATRRACEKFRSMPVAIMNFVEGTRFTSAKHGKQGTPYRHLLKPKSGGFAFTTFWPVPSVFGFTSSIGRPPSNFSISLMNFCERPLGHMSTSARCFFSFSSQAK